MFKFSKMLLKLVFVVSIFFAVTNISSAETVVYNTQTHKIHKVWCRWAAKCTVNCINIDRKEAVKRGGVPCKVCGG